MASTLVEIPQLEQEGGACEELQLPCTHPGSASFALTLVVLGPLRGHKVCGHASVAPKSEERLKTRAITVEKRLKEYDSSLQVPQGEHRSEIGVRVMVAGLVGGECEVQQLGVKDFLTAHHGTVGAALSAGDSVAPPGGGEEGSLGPELGP